MVFLSRKTNAPRLLHQVNNKPHATRDDHEPEDEGRRRTAEEADVEDRPRLEKSSVERRRRVRDSNAEREPRSSDDDDDDDDDEDTPLDPPPWQPPKNARKIRTPARTRAVVRDAKPSPQKRRRDSDDERERTVFAASQEHQRPRKQPMKTFSKKPLSQPSSQPTTAQKGQLRKYHVPPPPPAASHPKSKSGIKAPPPGASVPDSSQPESTRAFRRPAGSTDAAAPLTSTQTSAHSHPSLSPRFGASSPLSSIDESDLQDLQDLEHAHDHAPADPDPDVPHRAPCPLCGEQVDRSFHHAFQADFCRGRRMNLHLQEKFCRAHRARNAESRWGERGYPTIDWAALPGRLTAHHRHLRAVLDGSFESPFRREWEERLGADRTKSVAQSLRTGAGAFDVLRTGYYGTKGEKVMSEHIVGAFSRQLRTLSATDRLIASRGVSGGVSGYVHAVLVPELAARLVAEDMGCGRQEAARILADSAELGELLNEDEDEKVPRGDLGVEDGDEDGGGGGKERGGGVGGGGGGKGFRRPPSVVLD